MVTLARYRLDGVVSVLIVTAHPDPESLTHAVARALRRALEDDGRTPVAVADLAAEGFDPRFTLADRHTYRTGHDAPADVAAERERLDGVRDLVLVFPVYWWSLPALLKGWVDRVFGNGWAFRVGPDGGVVRLLGDLTVHLVPIAGDDAGRYERHGYDRAFTTQVEHGIVDYCGARRGVTAWLHESETEDLDARTAAVRAVVDAVRGALPRG